MRKTWITLGLLLLVFSATCAYSQNDNRAQDYLRGRFLVEGDYNRTAGFRPSCVLALDFQNERGHGMSLGRKIGPDSYATHLAYQIALVDAGSGWFYLQNRYLYRRFVAYDLQEFNAALLLGYRNIHWNFQLGLCNRYIAEVPLRLDGGMGTIFEPMNVVFNLGWNLFGEEHPWNVGLGLSNYREFIIERVTLFYYTVNSYYNVNSHWRLLGEAGPHPAGVLNLSSQYNGYFINVGFTYQR